VKEPARPLDCASAKALGTVPNRATDIRNRHDPASSVGGAIGVKAMIPHFTEAELLARQAERESNARTYPRGIPLAIERASGVEVFGVNGRRYLDFFAGAGVLALGHNHPRVVEAVAGQLGKFVHGLDFPSPARDDLTTELFATLPDGLRDRAKVHFCAPTGSDAVEAAIKLCKRATGRTGIIAFSGGYHGMTAGALAVTSLNEIKPRVLPLMPEVAFTPYGYCHRCAAKLVPATCGVACAALFESLLSDGHSGVPRPAATIMELVQGEGGSIVPPRDFVRRVRAATQEANVPLIADEIQAGFGRTGRFWAFEHFDVVPEVIVMSKALGGIGLPIAALVYKKELDVWEPGTHIGTFRGHQLAMAAGAAALRVFREDRILENVRARGDELLGRVREIRSPAISEVRGLGLMVGIELSHPETRVPLSAFAKRVRSACFDRGLLCELGGRADATLRLLPPLVVSRQQVAEAADILTDAIADADRGGFLLDR
jgi:diaminobutyrate-2-oxoglutarate transaminase